MKKNLNENISRVKSIMNLIYEEKEIVEPTATTETPATTNILIAPSSNQQYPKQNDFSAISDDIYQDLILNKIPNVKINQFGNLVFKSDKTTLKTIDFILDIDGVKFNAKFSRDGLYLENLDTKKQVRPVWTDKKLLYRKLNRAEKKEENKWVTTEPVLSLEEQIRILKKQFKDLYLL
jgi:hypothetical protein